nr:hypothetical protein GCM10020092_042610 [Actinoplanes digitatis]
MGLTTGVSLAFLGHDVTCVDLDQEKVDLLSGGRSPIYEPHMEALLVDAAERMIFTTDYSAAVPGADVVFIAVQTPSLPDGNPDLKYLRAAAESVGRHIDGEFTVVVNKSTVPIGSSNWVDSILRESFERTHERRSDGEFSVASNPEFLRQGAAIQDTLYPDRIVVGSDNPRSLDVLNRLYRTILNQTFTPPTYLPRLGRARRRADGLHRPGLGRADQVRRERVPGPEDQLRERDRPAGSAGSARTSPRSPAASAWTPGSGRASSSPASAGAAPASARTPRP